MHRRIQTDFALFHDMPVLAIAFECGGGQKSQQHLLQPSHKVFPARPSCSSNRNQAEVNVKGSVSTKRLLTSPTNASGANSSR